MGWKSTFIALVCLIVPLLIAQAVDAQEKITGPWLWMVAPTKWDRGGAASN